MHPACHRLCYFCSDAFTELKARAEFCSDDAIYKENTVSLALGFAVLLRPDQHHASYWCRIRSDLGLESNAVLIAGYPRGEVVRCLCCMAACSLLPGGLSTLSCTIIGMRLTERLAEVWRHNCKCA